MRHLVHCVVAVVGAGFVVLLSSTLTSAVWGVMTRIGPREVLTGVVCALVLCGVLEVKDLLMRRSASAQRRADPSLPARPVE